MKSASRHMLQKSFNETGTCQNGLKPLLLLNIGLVLVGGVDTSPNKSMIEQMLYSWFGDRPMGSDVALKGPIKWPI